jgi:hypothetical protein
MEEIGSNERCLRQSAADPIEDSKRNEPFRIKSDAGQLGDADAAALETEFFDR